MRDLRKAAEMALKYFEDAYGVDVIEFEIKEALRQALAQPEQEPVAWVYNGILHEFDPSEFATSEVTPLYTAPPKREWVGLTDEEVHEVVSKKWWDWEDAFDIEGFSRAIEAKLKEKNSV